MARFRLSAPAQVELAAILETSLDRWGEEARARYAALLAAAMQKIAANPDGPTTKDRSDLAAGLRGFHIRHARGRLDVESPVHVIFYRSGASGWIDVVRVLHERMDTTRHLGQTESVDPPPRGRRRRSRSR